MNKTIISLIIIVAVIGLWAAFFIEEDAQNDDKNKMAEEFFDKAPGFFLKDYNGNDISFTDFQGKIAVVNAWAVSCPFCKEELADFVKLQEVFPEIAVIAINRAESLEKAKGFTDSIGVSDKMIFLLDPDDSFYQSIGGFSMPETIFIDRDGNIRFHKRGPMQFEEMKRKVEAIISK